MATVEKDTFIRRLFLRAALRVIGAVTPSQQVNVALNQLFAMSIGDRHPATLDQQLANKSWVYAANRQIAGRGVKAQPVLELKQRQAITGKMPKATTVYDHPFLNLLRQPNLDQSGMVFHWQALLQLNTAGRVYILVEPQLINIAQNEAWMKALGGQPRIMSSLARMTLLEPERVRPYSALGRRAAAFEYFDLYGGHGIYPAAPATYAQREEWKQDPQPFVVRVFIPSPDTWNGQSVTEAVDHAINTSFGLQQMWQNQLKNGLHAGLIFYLNKKAMSEVERFEKAVALVKAGIGKAGEPLILPKEAVTVEPSPLNMKDMQYEALGEYSRREVLAGLGASDSIIGISEHSNRATADTAERVLAIGTIDPLNALIADAINAYILPLYPGQSSQSWYELRFTTAAASDEVVQTQVLTTKAGGPIITPNEARAELDKPPLPGGEELRPGGKGGGAMGGSQSIASDSSFPNTMGGNQFGAEGSKAPGFGGSMHEAGKTTEGGSMPQMTREDVATMWRETLREELARAMKPVEHVSVPVTVHAMDGEKAAEAIRSHAPIIQSMITKSLKRGRDMNGDGDCGCGHKHGPRGPRPILERTRVIKANHPLAALNDPATRKQKLRDLDKHRIQIERSFQRAMAPVFESWKRAAGKAVREHARSADLFRVRADKNIVAQTEEWEKVLKAAYAPWAVESSREVVLRALADYGLTDADIKTMGEAALLAIAQEFVERRSREFADQVSATQEDLIGDALSDGEAAELSADELGNAVEGVFPGMDDPKLREIARTETTILSGNSLYESANAINAGKRAGPSNEGPGATGTEGSTDEDEKGEQAKQSQSDKAGGDVGLGDEVGLMWLSMRDDKVRDSHATADGQVVAIGDLFQLDGCEAQYPGDDENCDDASEIVNCRCDAVVVPLEHSEGWENQDKGKWKGRSFSESEIEEIARLLKQRETGAHRNGRTNGVFPG